MDVNLKISFEPYYYFLDGVFYSQAGAFRVYNNDKLIGSADTKEEALEIIQRYKEDIASLN